MKLNLLACVFLLFFGGFLNGPLDAQPSKLTALMTDKLRNSQRLLEGIALSDFSKIADSAEKLIQLSKTAEWFAFKTPRYEMHSNEFRRAAETLIQKSKAKNIDGVVLAYMDMTLSCVRCHQYVRETRDARAPVLPPDLVAWAHP